MEDTGFPKDLRGGPGKGAVIWLPLALSSARACVHKRDSSNPQAFPVVASTFVGNQSGERAPSACIYFAITLLKRGALNFSSETRKFKYNSV